MEKGVTINFWRVLNERFWISFHNKGMIVVDEREDDVFQSNKTACRTTGKR